MECDDSLKGGPEHKYKSGSLLPLPSQSLSSRSAISRSSPVTPFSDLLQHTRSLRPRLLEDTLAFQHITIPITHTHTHTHTCTQDVRPYPDHDHRPRQAGPH